jgi:hypothetical protein
MTCEGAKERREGLITDMVQERELLEDSVRDLSCNPEAGPVAALAYLSVVVDRVLAAIIALAGPCCEGCDDEH